MPPRRRSGQERLRPRDSDGDGAETGRDRWSLVLIPRYGDMEATTTATTLGKRRVALLVEWSAFDPGGKLLWVQTVEGYARASTGLNHQKIVEMVVQDLLDKSTDAIKTSREIRPFVENSAAK